jgi:DHA3 family macrolide efflux protein-like MFS transporter
MIFERINKNLGFLLVGQLISQIGDKIYLVALSLFVLQETKSPAMMGIVMFFSLLPQVLVGFIAGSIVDKYNRRTILIVTDVLRGLVITVATILFYLKLLDITAIIITQILLSINSGFFNPTILAVIPQIVEPDKLSQANSKSQLVDGLTTIIGPILGGIAVASQGYTFILIFNAASYLISAMFESLMKVPTVSEKLESSKEIFKNLVVGYKFTFNQKKIPIILGMVVIVHFVMGSMQVIIPYFATKLSGNQAYNLGFIQSSFGVGAIAAALVLSIVNITGKVEKTLFGGIFFIGVFLMGLGVVNGLGVSSVTAFLVMFLLIGSSVILTATSFQVLLQKNTPNKMAGTVFGVASSAGNLAMPFASLIVGFLLNSFRHYFIFTLEGVLLILGCLLLYIIFTKYSQQRDLVKVDV